MSYWIKSCIWQILHQYKCNILGILTISQGFHCLPGSTVSKPSQNVFFTLEVEPANDESLRRDSKPVGCCLRLSGRGQVGFCHLLSWVSLLESISLSRSGPGPGKHWWPARQHCHPIHQSERSIWSPDQLDQWEAGARWPMGREVVWRQHHRRPRQQEAKAAVSPVSMIMLKGEMAKRSEIAL